ncbi:ADP-ribosyltransferase [Methanimicrococcus stummii]|uniref:ADP-ribosyltransferase n=1 Tax=Methanimicrococcus stummii TaxID=3028294 RepID=UPI00293007BF|nr:ADP-ribosyltransferase [Methanimicrococcus sp. Es2]
MKKTEKIPKAEKFTEYESNSANIVAERLELLQEYSTFLIPYNDRKNLSSAEKVCIGNYQDVHFWNNQKNDWSFPIPESWKKKTWCYAINSCCRDFSFYDSMTKEEKELIDFHFQNLDSAIQKSKADRDYWLYRGVNNIDWIKNPCAGTIYLDEAYGSFSLDFQKALSYTTSKEPILFRLNLKKKMEALYVDQAEAEILRSRRIWYKIKSITKETLEDRKHINTKIDVYTIEELRK